MRLKILEDMSPRKFFGRLTGFNTIDRCLNKATRDYYKFECGEVADIIKLNSDQCFDECHNVTGESVDSLREKAIDDIDKVNYLASVVISGESRLNIPFFDRTTNTQEGIHRVFAFERMFGHEEKFPVAVYYKIIPELNDIAEYSLDKYGKNFIRFKQIAHKFNYSDSDISEYESLF